MLNRKELYFGGICILLTLLYMFPYLTNGNNSYITISDNLDGSFAHLKCIFATNSFFDYNSELPMLDGMSRSSIPYSSPFELKALINYLFPGINGILINLFLVKLFAVCGMFLLLSNYIIDSKSLSFAISVAYFLIPFCSNYGLSSAGIPILLFATLNIYNKNNIYISFLLVFIYGFYSNFVLSGVFVCLSLFIGIVYLYYMKRIVYYGLISVLLILMTIYLLSNWSIIYGYFNSIGFISHRSEWISSSSIYIIAKEIIRTLLIGQWHAGEFPAFSIIMISLGLYLYMPKYFAVLSFYLKTILFLTLLIIIGFVLLRVFANQFPFNLSRFYFLYPALSYILLAKTCESALRMNKRLPSCIFALLFISSICVFSRNKEYIINVEKLFEMNHTKKPSFSQFYDEPLFEAISKDLKIEQDYTTKVVSLGLFPSVAEYNGFWCLDGYFVSYPLEYKHQFRKIICKEIDKDCDLKDYFDKWGNRCYLFSAELNFEYIWGRDDNKKVRNLDIDINELTKLGCQYIFSAAEILNYKDLGIELKNSYTLNNSYYKLYVYKVS